MGIGARIEAKSAPLPPGLQIAAPETEPVLALPPPALRRRHLAEPAEPDDQGDVDDLSARLQGGPQEVIQDPD